VGAMLVPKPMRGTEPARAASVARASWPKMWGSQNVANPPASARSAVARS